MFDFSHFSLTEFVITMAVLVLAITIHEFAHAFSADRLGDPTPRRQGRISLFPTDHLEPLGTVMMVLSSLTGFGIGWGKPVMVSPGNFRHPRRDHAIVSLAGPVSNLFQAVVFALVFRFALGGMIVRHDGLVVDLTSLGTFVWLGIGINLSLAFFNLIPIAPLDGHWIMGAILPREQADRYMVWMHRYGMLIFIGLVVLFPGVLSAVIGPPVMGLRRLLLHGIWA